MLSNAELEEHPDNIEGLEGLDDTWEIPYDELEFGGELARGNFGAVSVADYLGTKVAVKRLFDLEDDMKIYLQRELNVLKQIRHPNVVLFLGLSKSHEGLYLITEFVERGDLCALLYDRQGCPDLDSWSLRLKVSVAAAQGLNYLHAKNLIHRDIKAANYLVGDNWHIKLCDFGFSRSTMPNKGGQQDAGSVMTLCVPEDQEILTEHGFMDLAMYEAAVLTGHAPRIAGFNQKTKQLVFEEPRELFRHAAKQRTLVNMAAVANGVDMWVTTDHDLLAQWGTTSLDQGEATFQPRASNYERLNAGKLLRSNQMTAVRQIACAENGVHVDAVATAAAFGRVVRRFALATPEQEACFLGLVGMWLGNGALRSGAVSFFVAKSSDNAWVSGALGLLGLAKGRDYTQNATTEGLATHVTNGTWTAFWRREYGHLYGQPARGAFDAVSTAAGSRMQPDGTGAKWFARWTWTLAPAQLTHMLAGLERVQTRGASEVWTASPRFRDEVVRVALMAGRSAVATTDVGARAYGVVLADVVDSNKGDASACFPVLFKDRKEITPVAYGGRVWCFKMPSGHIWTRRAHKVNGVVVEASRAVVTKNCGTDEWMAPETMMGLDYGTTADVFSFGMFLVEVSMRREPAQRSAGTGFRFDISKFKRDLPSDAPEELAQVVAACTTYDPEQRPPMKKILEGLKELFKTYKEPEAAPEAGTVEEEDEEDASKARKREKKHRKDRSKDDKKEKREDRKERKEDKKERKEDKKEKKDDDEKRERRHRRRSKEASAMSEKATK